MGCGSDLAGRLHGSTHDRRSIGEIDIRDDQSRLGFRSRQNLDCDVTHDAQGAPGKVVARVGEGIVSAIGSADTHKHVLENPDRISKAVIARGLDAGTAFEILSIDIADVDVGSNIGAKLQADQAEADKRRFQAEAEKRRAMAIAQAASCRA